MPPMTGRVIAGRYNLQHPIGRGAMGVVWRARDQILDRDVAVKEVVISSLLGEEERRNVYQRTLREARTAARLSHRGLVAVYDVAEEDGRPWIVMELVPSRSLDQVLTVEGRLPPLRVARIGQQLLSALSAAHLAGVLHRDVKPSNVLIATDRTGTGWDERAVLTDFGIAQFEGDPRLTQTGMVMGSPGFTAPERIRGGDATHASDLWSLGATLYAAVEGRGPYEQRGGAITTMSAIINEDAPIAAHAGRLAQVIAALLRRDPAARPSAPTAARMFAHALSVPAASEEPFPAAHPPTAISKQVPPPAAPDRLASLAPSANARPGDGAAYPPPPESAAEPAAAVTPGSIDAPTPAVAAAPAVAPTARERSASVLGRVSAAPAAETVTPSPEASGESGESGESASHETPAEASSPDAPSPASIASDEMSAAGGEGAAAKEPGSAANEPEARPAEAEAPAAAGEPKAPQDAARTPPANAQADSEAIADDAEEPDDASEPAADGISAVEAATAIGPLETPDDIEGADVPAAIGELEDDGEAVEATEAVAAAEGGPTEESVNTAAPAEAGAAQSGPAKTVVDDNETADPPSEHSAPVARTVTPRPKPSPSFTAAKPGDRHATPTFSAARPGTPTGAPAARPSDSTARPAGYGLAQPRSGAASYGPAKHGPAKHGAASYGAASYGAASYGAAKHESPQPSTARYGANMSGGNSYGGPGAQQPEWTVPYLDQAGQYPLGPSGRSQRRLRPRWRIFLVILAVLAAVAIGAGAAIALGHHGLATAAGTRSGATVTTTAKTRFASVNALNGPSSGVPAGWVPGPQSCAI